MLLPSLPVPVSATVFCSVINPNKVNNPITTNPIPAILPIHIPLRDHILSNPSPPFHDSAYMRRVIDRAFQRSESFKENEPKAIEFVGWLLALQSLDFVYL